MIKRLRKRFIRIATLAVTGVMLVLCIALNTANFLSVRAEQQRMLDMICNNQGTLPSAPPGGGQQPGGGRADGSFTPETPFSTRYFVLRYNDEGPLVHTDFAHIAARAAASPAATATASSTLRTSAGWPSFSTAPSSCAPS